MPYKKRAIAIAALVGAITASAGAADKTETGAAAPKIFQDVVDCRKITADAERLSCYDRNVAALESAQQQKELYVADKEEVRKSRKGLFGFTLSDIGIFGGDKESDKVVSIEASIKSVRETAGKYMFTLDDGAVWMQTEAGYIGLTPRPGQTIFIKRAAMGSYVGRVGNGRTFRIKRLNT
jgi:hypothetical protein